MHRSILTNCAQIQIQTTVGELLSPHYPRCLRKFACHTDRKGRFLAASYREVGNGERPKRDVPAPTSIVTLISSVARGEKELLYNFNPSHDDVLRISDPSLRA